MEAGDRNGWDSLRPYYLLRRRALLERCPAKKYFGHFDRKG